MSQVIQYVCLIWFTGVFDPCQRHQIKNGHEIGKKYSVHHEKWFEAWGLLWLLIHTSFTEITVLHDRVVTCSSVTFAGGQHAAREQSRSEDFRASEKDQLLPLYPPLRTKACSDTGCQLAGHKWTVLALSTSFPCLLYTHLWPVLPVHTQTIIFLVSGGILLLSSSSESFQWCISSILRRSFVFMGQSAWLVEDSTRSIVEMFLITQKTGSYFRC